MDAKDADPQSITLELEIDSSVESNELLNDGRWQGEGERSGISISVLSQEEGHGFGLTEVITIVVTAAATVASETIVEAIRDAVGRVIRQARTKNRRADGSREDMRELIDDERNASD